MNDTLSVKLKGLSDCLISDWISEMNKWNMHVEVHPDFTFHNHAGFLPFKVILSNCPNRDLNHIDLISGFGLLVKPVEKERKRGGWLKKLFSGKRLVTPIEVKLQEADTELLFAISTQDSIEFRMGWYSAASLAVLCDGVLTDIQRNIQLEGQRLIEHACKVVTCNENSIADDEWIMHKFAGWIDLRNCEQGSGSYQDCHS